MMVLDELGASSPNPRTDHNSEETNPRLNMRKSTIYVHHMLRPPADLPNYLTYFTQR